MTRFVIDPGHGGMQDVGKSSWGGGRGPRGSYEKDVNLRLARSVAAHLGDCASLTRSGDCNRSLAERARVARDAGARVFLSLHANQGSAEQRGAEVFVHSGAALGSRQLAKALGRSLDRSGHPIALPSVQQAELAVLDPRVHALGTAACLLEVDYLSHPDAERELLDPSHIDRIGRSIAQGLRAYDAVPVSQAMAVSVPWSGTFDITTRLPKSRVFTVTRGAVTVEASATWSGYRTIPLPPQFTIRLWKENSWWRSNDNKGGVTYPTTGTSATNTWSDLENGDYYLEIDVGNTDPAYRLRGNVSVT